MEWIDLPLMLGAGFILFLTFQLIYYTRERDKYSGKKRRDAWPVGTDNSADYSGSNVAGDIYSSPHHSGGQHGGFDGGGGLSAGGGDSGGGHGGH
jgi:hypothetical protein